MFQSWGWQSWTDQRSSDHRDWVRLRLLRSKVWRVFGIPEYLGLDFRPFETISWSMKHCMAVIIRPKVAVVVKYRLDLCGLMWPFILIRDIRDMDSGTRFWCFCPNFTATNVVSEYRAQSVMSWLYKHLSWHAGFSRLCLSIVAYFLILLTFKLNLRQALHIVITTHHSRSSDMLLLSRARECSHQVP